MPDKYYDVIVIGRSIGALVAAALLARRDFTVLVLGNGRRPADYSFAGRTLRRRAFTMLAASSPVYRRILGELAQTQTWNRRIEVVSPMLQLLLPGKRFDVPPDAALFAREVERVFPEVRRLVSELYANLARITVAADAGFSRDAVWPPGTFFERRETGRVAATLPYARAEPHADLLAEFPPHHPYPRIVNDSVRFATDMALPPPAFAVARLHGAWTRGLVELRGGERELDDMLLERIEANGGAHLLDEKVASLEVRRGAVTGLRIDGETRAMGAGFVITDLAGEEVAALAGGLGISKYAQREWPRIVAGAGRYVVSLLVRAAGVPSPLAREALLVSREPTIHLQRVVTSRADEVLLVAELLRRDRETPALQDLRALVVERLCGELPFLEQHLMMVDSVYDGLPLWCFERALLERGDSRARRGLRFEGPPLGAGRLPACAARPIEVERSELEDGAARGERMDRQLEVDPPGYLGLGGEPVRGPIERTLLVGASVLPALGQEGRMLAGVSAARLVTESDKRKARMRREMWTKLEIS
jgi:phytoene dehydrogenase-like protein